MLKCNCYSRQKQGNDEWIYSFIVYMYCIRVEYQDLENKLYQQGSLLFNNQWFFYIAIEQFRIKLTVPTHYVMKILLNGTKVDDLSSITHDKGM